MTEIGIFLLSEEHGPRPLVDAARAAEEAGFRSVWVSDHFHPWTSRQGQSPFVWSVVGGILATTDLRVATAVTCPTFRTHPAVIAQAAATSAAMAPARFRLGVGSGEALNEHIVARYWPSADVRLEMLQEAIELMRRLWTGEQVDWRGRHFTVDGARLYTLPDEELPVLVSAFGPKAMDLVLSHGDGWITTKPDEELMAAFRAKDGSGPAGAGVKVCWAPDEDEARRLAHDLWPTSGLSGEISQVLPMPEHFEQAVTTVTEDDVADQIACGPDPEVHVAAIRPYLEAGFDEVYLSQIGPDQTGFFEFFRREVEPRL